MRNRFIQYSFFILILTSLIHCDNEFEDITSAPVLSTLFNNRMLLLVKGTYASDNPISFQDYNGGTGALYLDNIGEGGDADHQLIDLPSAANLPIYIDLGEIRISSQFDKGINELTQIRNPIDSQEFWDFIATERQVFCTIPYTLENDTCQKQNGLFRMQQFFDGTGAQFPSNDPTAETISCSDPKYFNECAGLQLGPEATFGRQYFYTGIYFRSFVTGWGVQNGALLLDQARFDNRRVTGVNIVPRNNYIPGTSDIAKQDIVPKMFPQLYSVQGGQRDMQIRGGFDPYILEIRMNIKENLMVHTFQRPGNPIKQTLVGFSDALSAHKNEPDIGGNMISRSRIIYPETAASLSISGGQGDLRYYYAIFHSDEINIIRQIPLAATPARQNASIKYINNGKYKLYCVADLERVDGFPDTIIRETEFVISDVDRRNTIALELSCP
ncbi:LIC11270 family surface protein [Leptospira sp. GIMC2001]|uniref:LIC11270 family surface protein n=1 Tax=Leptospira sp. GIMC2001 TaxID=1513297 RepID=UPI0023492F41|nr:hypothetical protein [Leptospira sp. GIMC2001]WCL50044.1 hypothetical protein O4O04_04275 [Leptospira sp. GIMC2001]